MSTILKTIEDNGLSAKKAEIMSVIKQSGADVEQAVTVISWLPAIMENSTHCWGN